VVEGSLTIALVAFGGARVSTVEAVLIYRLISFWGELVVGWASVGWLAIEVHRGRWRRRTRPGHLVGPPTVALVGGSDEGRR
jgi:hypothetical protein